MFKGGLWVTTVVTITKQNHYAISSLELEKFKHLEGNEKLTIKEYLEIVIWRAKPLVFCAKHLLYLESWKGCMARNCQWLTLEAGVRVYV
jgi:hypothetical protein